MLQKRRVVIFMVLLGYLVGSLEAGSWNLNPQKPLYPILLADRNFPRFSLSFPFYTQQTIDTQETDSILSPREFLEFGGVKSLFRYSWDKVSTELSIGAGVITLFDAFEDRLDNFGWEGSSFVTINVSIQEAIVLRGGIHHLSSHVGDEYLANYDVISDPDDISEGSTYGMNYVRDALLGGIAITLPLNIRLIAEVRYSLNMFRYFLRYNAFPWQAQLSVEFIWPHAEASSHHWYLALHTSAFQEDSWFMSTTVQFGGLLHQTGRSQRFRYGIEFYYGRPQIAAFNYTASSSPTAWDAIEPEQAIAFGIWYDF